ncbi:MAG: hypothetical protein NW226_07185 [Microscillaceae bacterium]|nr:hypothetical protein [Microscillaceae bacterium]
MDQQAFLQQSETVRTSYLVLLSALASADHDNSEEEIAFMEQMAAVAGLSGDNIEQVKNAMKNPAGIDMKGNLANFKDNELKFALVTDLLNLAYKDGDLEKEEVAQIQQVNQILEISDEQYDALQKYVQAANKEVEGTDGNADLDEKGEPKETPNNFLEKTGLEGMFKKAGIPTGNFLKGSTISAVLTGAAFYVINNMMNNKDPKNQAGGLAGTIGGLLSGLMAGNQAQGQTQTANAGAMGGLGNLIGGMLGGGQGKGGANLGGLLNTVIAATSKGKGLGNLVDIIGGGAKKQGQGGSALGNILGSLLSGK